MRPESSPFLAAGLSALLVAACASSPARDGEAAASSTATMSNKGLANMQLAQNYLRNGKLDIALDRANRAFRSDPDSPDVQLVMGMIRQALKDEARAGEHFAKAEKLAPERGHVLNVRAVWLCEQGRFDEADALFGKALRDPFSEDRRQIQFNAGRCAMLGGRLDRAEAHLRAGLESSPEDPGLLLQMARLQYRQGDYFGARAFYQRREAVGEVTPDLLDLAASIEEGAGDPAAAERYRRRLREQFPDYTPTAQEEAPRS